MDRQTPCQLDGELFPGHCPSSRGLEDHKRLNGMNGTARKPNDRIAGIFSPLVVAVEADDNTARSIDKIPSRTIFQQHDLGSCFESNHRRGFSVRGLPKTRLNPTSIIALEPIFRLKGLTHSWQSFQPGIVFGVHGFVRAIEFCGYNPIRRSLFSRDVTGCQNVLDLTRTLSLPQFTQDAYKFQISFLPHHCCQFCHDNVSVFPGIRRKHKAGVSQ
mmetsp:Transcript_15284/g.32919  ORF Transcript_15284/g.32919 Transcript_15284/m.32919 type:complete len:216 (+) Transcript_15284:3048-3695(+)